MIEYIKGELTEVTPTYAVIECCGVGYNLSISLNTYATIQEKSECKLFVHEAIREDAHQLFGFATKVERQLFTLLISVSGIGGSTASLILSSLSPRELADVIATENVNVLKSVKGIGAKTAQRVIVDLKDKVLQIEGLDQGAPGNTPLKPASRNSQVQEEAFQALVMLGFAGPQSSKVVKAILEETPEASVEQVIKTALKRL